MGVEGPRAATTIGRLGRATGCNIETIRYYERIGLLPRPARSVAGYRLYGPDHERRLVFVRKARALGFPLDTIRDLLRLADDPERPCAEVDRLVAARLAEVERKLADLARLKSELESLAHQCRGGRIAECRIVEALSPA
jgi:DNA-binding transcriptional MerR regulator